MLTCQEHFGLRPPPGLERDALPRALERERVAVSARGSAMRVAPQVYNDAVDLVALVRALRSTLRGAPA